MLKLLFDTSYVLDASDDYKAKWCMFRAIEWGQWPLFITQPLAPLALAYLPTEWGSLLISLVVISWLWKSVCYRLVSLPLAQFGSVFVHLKWLTAIGSGIYLAYLDHYKAAGLASLWPIVAVVLQFATPSTKIGVMQQLFANRIFIKEALSKPSTDSPSIVDGIAHCSACGTMREVTPYAQGFTCDACKTFNTLER